MRPILIAIALCTIAIFLGISRSRWIVEPIPDFPVIDLSQNERINTAAIKRAAETLGLFYLKNHGIPASVIEATFSQSATFFSLPLPEKLKVKVNNQNRGYTPFSDETLDPQGQTQGDTKEGYYLSSEWDAQPGDEKNPFFGPNQWPNETLVPEWKQIMENYFNAQLRVAQKLARLFAGPLNMESLLGYFERPNVWMRLIHYNEQPSNPNEGIFGAGAHTDYGMITILATDENPGLQIETNDGVWVDVPPIPNTFIVTTGDLMKRCTNDIYKSPRHRVVNKLGKERYSIAFWFDPCWNCVVEVLPQCTEPENPPKYKATTTLEHILEMYQKTKLHEIYKGTVQRPT